MKKSWNIIKTILNNIFRFAVVILLIIIFVGLSPIIALFLVIGWVADNWSRLIPEDMLKIGTGVQAEEKENEGKEKTI